MFDEIEGHKTAKRTLQRALSEERMAHAYLFSGPDGVGKKLTAISFAKKLNCREKRDSYCQCSCCSRIKNGIFPDVSLFEYEDKKLITVNNVREEIERGIFLKPFESQYKIFIIAGAERMNASAQNAFLKTLEEPPSYSVIILTTHLPSRILPTVRSRCHTVAFGKLDGETARKKLRERGDLGENDIALAVKLAGGSPGKVSDIGAEQLSEISQTIQKLAGINVRNPSEVFEFAENILAKAKGTAMQRVAAEKFTDLVSFWIQDLIYASAGAGEPVYEKLGEASAKFTRHANAVSIAEKARSLEDAVAGIKTGNLNCRLVLENLIFKIAEM